MEGLNLSDLQFDAENDVFDVFKSTEGGSKETPKIEDPTTKTKNTDSEGKQIASPEKVTTEENQGKAEQGTEKSSNSSSPQPVDNSKLFTSLAAEMKSKGVLPSLDLENTEIKSLEDLQKAVKAEIDSGLDERSKAIEKAMRLGLDANRTATQLDTINKLKEIPADFVAKPENINFRRDVMVQDFINKGYDKERATTMAQRSIDAGTDLDDADFALKAVIQHEENQYEAVISKAQEKDQKEMNDIEKVIHSESEILPGVTLTKEQKQDMYEKITTDLGGRENAYMKAKKEDPINSRVKAELLFHLTKGYSDFSVFGKKQVQEANKGFEDLLKNSSFAVEGTPDGTGGDDSSFSLKDLKDLTFQ